MNKKEYKKPSMKVVQLDSTEILAGSPGGKARIIDEEVDDSQKPDNISSDIWGKPW